jgi:hypothetical protein
MSGNTTSSNQQSAGFNPNAVSFSSGFASSNMKSFSAFNGNNNNANSNSSQTTGNIFGSSGGPNLFNPQPPTINNSQSVSMNQNNLVNSSQGNSFGQSSGFFGTGNNNTAGFSQQQTGGNFLSAFNPLSQGQKAPVIPNANSHLLQPRK